MIWIKNQETIKKNLRILSTLTLTCLAIYCAIRYSKECSQGVLKGISFCVTILVPSLFVFMIIASFISNSVVSGIISKPFCRITEKALGLPKESASVIILSLIGGYPIGARCVESLFESNGLTEAQAKKLSLIAVSSGPGFVINFVGSALLNSKEAGLILFVSQIVGFFTVAFLVGRFIKTDSKSVVIKQQNKGSFVNAVEKGCKATIDMCAMVIAFSVITAVINEVLKYYPMLCDLLTGILEVTTACNLFSLKYPLYVTSLVIGFGGVCVHAQIFSALNNVKINKMLFFLFRIIQGITAGLTTYILLILFPVSVTVFSSVENTKPTTGTSLVGMVALILTAVCFLNSLSKINLKRR